MNSNSIPYKLEFPHQKNNTSSLIRHPLGWISYVIFAWILLAYISFTIIFESTTTSMSSVVFMFHINEEQNFVFRIRELFLFIGIVALVTQILASIFSNRYKLEDILVHLCVSILYLILFIKDSSIQNSTFLLLLFMSWVNTFSILLINIVYKKIK